MSAATCTGRGQRKVGHASTLLVARAAALVVTTAAALAPAAAQSAIDAAAPNLGEQAHELAAPRPVPHSVSMPLPLPSSAPSSSIGFYLGGGVPGAVGGAMAAERGVHRFVAARAMALGLVAPTGAAPRGRFIGTFGPSLVLDAIAWVPRVYAQVGVTAGPFGPCAGVGLELERYVGLRTSVRAWIQGTWVGHSQFRGDAMAGLGIALF